MNDKITIITPYYKGSAYMEQYARVINANAELLWKTFPGAGLEVILVNDSPGFDIPEMSFHEKISFKTLTHEKNGGIHKARITGLNAATGDYVLFLDQDDTLRNDALVSQLSKIGDFDMVVSNADMEDKDGNLSLLYPNETAFQKVLTLDCYTKSHNQIASPGQCLIKKEVIPSEWGQYFTQKNGSDDLFLWILLFSKKCSMILNPEPLYTHKYTGSNLSENDAKMSESSLEVAEYLKEISYCPEKMIRDFIKARDNSSALSKAGIILFRVKWKLKILLNSEKGAKTCLR